MAQTPDQKEYEASRERLRSKTFIMMLQLALVFGVPAVLAVIFGQKLERRLAGDFNWTLAFLAFAFMLSWALTVRMYVSLSREARQVDQAARSLKAKQEKNNNPKNLKL